MEGFGSDGSGDLQCIGKLEVVSHKPVGFLCGTLPVPTDKAFHASDSALVPSSQTVSAPRYRLLPMETDLNTPPLLSNFPDKGFPISALHPRTSGDFHWESGAITQNLARKCEMLAVSGLVEYGDEIDVIAPADILKQIFKMPYSKARLSIAVHRIGQTLVLNTGPDVEEGEKLVRRHSNQSKCVDQSLFLNFAMHSVRMEACDCPPGKYVPHEEESNPTIFPGQFDSTKGSFVSPDLPNQGDTSQILGQSGGGSQREGLNGHAQYPQGNQGDFFLGGKKSKRNSRCDAVKKASQVGEKPRCTVQESEKYRRVGGDDFLRVLFWKFHNFRMLLGSDLLLFSNEKYAAVSLHLWDVARQVTPLTWLEAWLDNVMASVPELAICYHQNGVVQGYELLKTDDIFLLKGISEDGTPAFHPHVVQQNGLSVLRFLQENCKQDPGAYWLYKSAGEDVIQLFDLSVLPKNHSPSNHDKSSSSLSSIMHRGRRDSLFSLGTLLYRVAHRLSFSGGANGRARCARFFKKCLDFLDEQDHLVVRAFAHEQFARFILKYHEELDLTSESVPIESEVTVTDAEDEPSDLSLGMTRSLIHDESCSQIAEDAQTPSSKDGNNLQDSLSGEPSLKMTLEANLFSPKKFVAPQRMDGRGSKGTVPSSCSEDSLAVCEMASASAHMVQTVADPISSRLAAIHHVSQAIKSLRWKRQLQDTELKLIDHGSSIQERSSTPFTVCACGDTDCIEVCDIREWLPRLKMDHKLWKLVLLLGESYLLLGQAYKEDGQLRQTLKVVDLACSIYGSMPQHIEEEQFTSSMVISTSQSNFGSLSGKTRPFLDKQLHSDFTGDCLPIECCSSPYLFWAKAWTLVGDVYVEHHMVRGKEIPIHPESKPCSRKLRMPSEVMKEVKRLKKKLGQYKQNCSTCSLINCSCQSDRASSGNSASSSTGDVQPLTHGRKQSKRLNAKKSKDALVGTLDDSHVQSKEEPVNAFEGGCLPNNKGGNKSVENSKTITNNLGEASWTTNSIVEGPLEVQDSGSLAATDVETNTQEASKEKTGGIFKFLQGPVFADEDSNLSSAISCYDAARQAMDGLPTGLAELQSVLKKKGWVCNELGRQRLERKDLDKAELAFAEAIKAFREVSDHTNIILIECNLGHGRRALAEEMVLKIENLKAHVIFQNAYNKALNTAKLEYCESLRYYGAARSELNALGEGTGSVSSTLRNEVYTQFANTYLRLGMLLAREDITAEVYENRTLEHLSLSHLNPLDRRARKELRKHEISANDAIREAVYMYESLGELRKQEAAYAYFQLACYHRDCCLRFSNADHKHINPSRGESNSLQKVKQYASLAERNWQKSIDFYGAKTHPIMYLTILMERSALSLNLSDIFHSNTPPCFLAQPEISFKLQVAIQGPVPMSTRHYFCKQHQVHCR
uniref:EDRF1 N-terminal domain-containing protein n=1 Tax=Nelumbo nucifera TaxID=4432 RepID=A0A822XX37_NELNU|nr:TPA_asm: hypothetical protein HUJ06_025757 [Nelumbo nucifera]